MRTSVHFSDRNYLHWQNLNERQNRPDGPMIKHGRAWLVLGPREVNAEWVLGRRDFHAYIRLGGGDSDREVGFSLALPFIGSFYLTFDGFVPSKWMPGKWTQSYFKPGEMWRMPIQKKIGIAIFDSTVWFSLWETCGEWSSSQPWWWEFTFKPLDFLLGSSKYSEETLQEVDTEVPMPEGKYAAKVRLFKSTWKRPRWPFAQHIFRANVDVDGGIPIPGKGENSYDIGDDAVFSLTTPAKTVRDAVKSMADSVLRSRYRYSGGYDWKPDEPERWALPV